MVSKYPLPPETCNIYSGFVVPIPTLPCVYIYTHGSVGIGTTNPEYILHVSGGSGYFDTNTGADPLIIARAYGTNNPQEIRIGVTDAVATVHYINDEQWNRIDFRMQNTATAGGSGTPNDNIVMSICGDPDGGKVGIGTTVPTSPLQVIGLPSYSSNSAAIAGGLTVGAFYRNGDNVCVVH